MIQKLTVISAQIKSPGVKKSFLSHIYDWIQHKKLIYMRYIETREKINCKLYVQFAEPKKKL